SARNTPRPSPNASKNQPGLSWEYQERGANGRQPVGSVCFRVSGAAASRGSRLAIGRMNTTLNPDRSFFRILAWYAVIVPFAAAGITGIGLLIGIPRHPSGSPAEFTFNVAACVVITSVLASIVSL